MKLDLKEFAGALKYISDNSQDMSVSVREDGKILKLIVTSKNGSLIEIDLYDEEMCTHARVRESRELLIK